MFDSMVIQPTMVSLTLYTDAFVIRGTIETRQRRVLDILNMSDDPFLVLTDVTFDEFGPHGQPVKAEFAQVNLASVVLVVSDETIEPLPELRTPKVAEQAVVSVPPFKVTGQIHLMPERSLREALTELHGQFVPVTDATYWSDSLGEARASASMVAVNHSLAQILAPHRELDPWAGLPAATEATEATEDVPPSPEPTGW
jgi:hypothetical protein